MQSPWHHELGKVVLAALAVIASGAQGDGKTRRPQNQAGAMVISSIRPLAVTGEVNPGPEAVIQPDTSVQNVTFSLINSSGGTVETRTEQRAPYCFSGDTGGPCNPWDTTSYPDGHYELRAVASLNGGGTSEYTVR